MGFTGELVRETYLFNEERSCLSICLFEASFNNVRRKLLIAKLADPCLENHEDWFANLRIPVLQAHS